MTLIIDLLTFDLSFCAEEFFLDPSSQRETTVDVGKMKEVAQEPATLAEALELFLMEWTQRHTNFVWSTAKLNV